MYAEDGFQTSSTKNRLLSQNQENFFNDEDENSTVDPNFISMLDNDLDYMDKENFAPDLYAVLGVARDATEAELRAAYRKMSKILHPDKHSPETQLTIGSTNLRDNAETAFARLNAAYTVLSDKHQRAIYDQYGYEGLRIQGWELAVRDKSAPELRLEYMMLKQKAKDNEKQQLMQPESEFCIGIDMTDIFDRYLQEPPNERDYMPSISVYELIMSQSITVGRTLRNTVTLAGQVTAHNGLGVGALLATWQHNFPSKTPLIGTSITETQLSYGRGGRAIGCGVRIQKQFHERVTGSLGVECAFKNNAPNIFSAIPGMSTAITLQITPRIYTRLQYKLNFNGGLFSDVWWSSVNGDRSCSLQSRILNSGEASISMRLETCVDWALLNPFKIENKYQSYKPNNQEHSEWFENVNEMNSVDSNRRGRLSVEVGFNSYDLFESRFGVNCGISEVSRLHGEIALSWIKGISFKFSLHRGTQTYSIPIRMSDHWDPVAIGYGAIIPIVIYGVVRRMIYEPWVLKQLKNVEKVRRQRLRDELRQLQSEALATQSLMQNMSTRTAASEKASNGLVIHKAFYGSLSDDLPNILPLPDDGGALYVDVTIPLQALVNDHLIRLPPGRWADLQGFYDPCVGLYSISTSTDKQLFVAYSFNDLPHEVLISEHRGLAIPMSKHRVTNFSSIRCR